MNKKLKLLIEEINDLWIGDNLLSVSSPEIQASFRFLEAGEFPSEAMRQYCGTFATRLKLERRIPRSFQKPLNNIVVATYESVPGNPIR